MSFKIIRTSTIPLSLNTFCRGLLRELQEEEGYEVVAVSSPEPQLEEVATRERVKTVAVPMERHMSPLKDLVSLMRLIRVFRREKPMMVHSMTPKAGLLSMMAARLAGVPLRVHTFTGLVFPTATGLTKRILMFTDRLTCACATHIVPEGEGVKNDLISHHITGKPLQVLGHGNIRGIDLDHYDPERDDVAEQASEIRRRDLFTFIFIGRLVGDKGINELVEAFERLNNEYPDSRLILVGRQEPDLDPLNTETLAKISQNKNIESVGQQSDVRPWLAASDVLVFPSYREGFPNVVIEAGAMGLPSVVTDINGSREIIIDGQNGIIVPPRDAEALFRGMKRLFEDRCSVERMRSNARPLIASRYEQSYVRDCLKGFYKKIIGNEIV